jgi:uncharacterized protein YcfJ
MKNTQNDSTDPNSASNPWKIGTIATAASVLLLTAVGFTVAAINNSKTSTEQPVVAASTDATSTNKQQSIPVSVPAPDPIVTAQPRENCDQYRINAQRDNMQIAQTSVIGAAVGAGTGAAGGAIADGGDGAGTGAGIGAVVGAVAGGAYGLTKEDERVSAAEGAYQDCLRRNP